MQQDDPEAVLKSLKHLWQSLQQWSLMLSGSIGDFLPQGKPSSAAPPSPVDLERVRAIDSYFGDPEEPQGGPPEAGDGVRPDVDSSFGTPEKPQTDGMPLVLGAALALAAGRGVRRHPSGRAGRTGRHPPFSSLPHFGGEGLE